MSSNSNAENNFFDTIRYNISRGMYFYPDFRLSFFHNFTKQVDGKDTVQSEKNVTRFFQEFLASRKVDSPVDVTVKLFTFKMSGDQKLLLATAFFAPSSEDGTVSCEDINRVRDYVKMTFGTSAQHIFLVAGSAHRFDESCGPATDPTVILCEYIKHDIWSHRLPDFYAGELTRRFLVHILPGKYSTALADIISLHDDLSGNINVASLKRSLVYSAELDDATVIYALDELFMNGKYAVDKNGNILSTADHPQLPDGFRISRRFSRPAGLVRRMYYYWIIISILLPLLVQAVSLGMGIALPWWISGSVSLISLLVAKYSWQAKVRFHYNIK